MKKFMSLFVAFVLIFVVSACGNDTKDEGTKDKVETVTVTHDLGTTEVEKNPKKVVVFDFGTLDTLDALDVDVVGVPKDSIPSYLKKFDDAKYENVGGLKEPDFEKISEINPDLIIISGRQADMYEEFTKIAKTIYMGVDTANYIESFETNVRTLAEIFDKVDLAEEKLATIAAATTDLNTKAVESAKNGLIILANDGKISAYGPNSRFGIIHDVFGVPAADDTIEVSTHGQGVSFEYILEKNPDYLFVVDRGAVVGGESSAKKVIENTIVKKTKAYKEGKIIYLNPDYWYLSGGGLVSVAEMAKEIAEGIK